MQYFKAAVIFAKPDGFCSGVIRHSQSIREQSFMIEGLFNTGISLFMTIIIGIPGGYMIGTFLEKAGMSTGFVFPTRAFLLFVTVMLLLEVLMTILLIHSWKKQSVIEIMRN